MTNHAVMRRMARLLGLSLMLVGLTIMATNWTTADLATAGLTILWLLLPGLGLTALSFRGKSRDP